MGLMCVVAFSQFYHNVVPTALDYRYQFSDNRRKIGDVSIKIQDCETIVVENPR